MYTLNQAYNTLVHENYRVGEMSVAYYEKHCHRIFCAIVVVVVVITLTIAQTHCIMSVMLACDDDFSSAFPQPSQPH